MCEELFPFNVNVFRQLISPIPKGKYLHEYILTLPLEIETVWMSKFNTTKVLFLVNRYAFMINWIINVVSNTLSIREVPVSLYPCFSNIYPY